MRATMMARVLLAAAVAVAFGACDDGTADKGGKKGGDKTADKGGDAKKPDDKGADKGPAIKTDKGVDATAKTVKIGALNDESGPAATIGKPFAIGKRLAVAQANEGGLLPEGWKVELVEKDHGYNPQKAVQAYKEVKDEVLFIATSFGTPNTLPLRPQLKTDGTVAFPASLSSKMAEDAHTPPLGPSYAIEAMRAMDWIVEQAGAADKVKAAIVYQQDDYGKDGLEGFKKAAGHHKVTIVSEQTVAPGQKDYTAVVTALKDAGATHILLAVLPSATGPILGTAAQLKFMPIWVGNTPAWIDGFFSPKVIPPVVFTNFYLISGMPYWGEKVPGMDKFMEVFKKHGKDARPDSYILLSYVQGLVALEILKKAIESGDATRAGYKKALSGIKDWNGGGLTQNIDLSKVPYVTGTRTRVLKPVMDKQTWEQKADYAEPKSMAAK